MKLSIIALYILNLLTISCANLEVMNSFQKYKHDTNGFVLGISNEKQITGCCIGSVCLLAVMLVGTT